MAEKANNSENIPQTYVKDSWQAHLMAEKEDIYHETIKVSRAMVDISKKKWGARSRDRADILEQSHQDLVDKFDLELEEYGENMADIVGFLEILRSQAEYASNTEEYKKQYEMENEINAGVEFFGLTKPDIKAPNIPAINLFMRQSNISRATRLSDSIFDAHRHTE